MTAQTSSATAASVRAPGLLRLALEARAPFEFAASLASFPILAGSPRGDGHPIVVYPGFMASDFSTRPMRRLLRLLNHNIHGWDQGRNTGISPEAFELALSRIRALYVQHERKISLVGWSLGGLYARELAKQAPELIRSVVTLGSPFAGSPRDTNAWRLFELINSNRPRVRLSRESLKAPPPVPTTSIYSRSDGIVAWQSSLELTSATTESIEVTASHTGMGVNPTVLHALADRLAQPEGNWQPFNRSGLRKWVFPEPAHQTSI